MWSDWGLRRALWWFSLLLQPHAVVVPGDMLDEGKRCDDSQHEQLLQRFKAVFQAHKSDQWHMMLPLSSHPIPLILTPGNHDSPPPLRPDQGYDEHVQRVRLRTTAAFGAGSCTCVRGHAFHTIDTSGIFYDGDDDLHGALGAQSGGCHVVACGQERASYRPGEGHHVVVTHVPLHRSSDEVCGKERGQGGGVTYLRRNEALAAGQDVLSEHDSALLMQAAAAKARQLGGEVSVVLAGHTHAPCFITSPALSGGGSSNSSSSGGGGSSNSSSKVLHATLSASGWRMRPDASCALLVLHERASHGSLITLLSLPHEHTSIAVVAAACVAVAAAASRVAWDSWRSFKRSKSS